VPSRLSVRGSLLLVSLGPPAAAIVVGLVGGFDRPISLTQSSDVTALVSVITLIALGPIAEVIGHELVGYRHTIRVVEREGGVMDHGAERSSNFSG
jgi:LytS/YehU family sensor histidine kinase